MKFMSQVAVAPPEHIKQSGSAGMCVEPAADWVGQSRRGLPETGSQVWNYITKWDCPLGHGGRRVTTDQRAGGKEAPGLGR